MKSVVPDKTAVYSPRVLQRLAAERRLLFTHILFYEILTTSPEERSRCIANLVPIQDSLVLVAGLGELLRYEASTGLRCKTSKATRDQAASDFTKMALTTSSPMSN